MKALRRTALRVPGRLFFSDTKYNNPFFKVSEEVKAAVFSKKPVVALETTIYTHGFPYPQNVVLSSHLEAIVRDKGGIPATIGVLNGVAKVGLNKDELDGLLASAGSPKTLKVSRRDLSYILGKKGLNLNGGTTIAGTIVLAHLAGIEVFATGGLGGVHQGGENSMDISADLTELGRTPIALISSGCKSFLDIPRTLEYLETQGVGVSTFADGRQGNIDFPAFWTRESGTASPSIVQDAIEAASIIHVHKQLRLRSGLLFANPIAENASLSKARMDAVMAEAIQEARQLGFTGSQNTPFILKRIKELTGGDTVTANEALVRANVERGIEVALELSRLKRNQSERTYRWNHLPESVIVPNDRMASIPHSSVKLVSNESNYAINDLSMKLSKPSVLVVGSAAVDLSCDYDPLGRAPSSNVTEMPLLHTSNPANITQNIGGVGYNVAITIYYLGVNVKLCSVVGGDLAGRTILKTLREHGMRTDGISVEHTSRARTAQYIAFNDSKKQLVMAAADMKILEKTQPDIQHLLTQRPNWVVLDANWSPDVLHRWVAMSKGDRVKVAFEPVSVDKAKRLFTGGSYTTIDMATPNALELEAMWIAARDSGRVNFLSRQRSLFDVEALRSKMIANLRRQSDSGRAFGALSESDIHAHIPKMLDLLGSINVILTKLGANGVLMAELLFKGDERLNSPTTAPYVYGFPSSIEHRGGGEDIEGVYVRYFPAIELVSSSDIVSVNGVGDTFLGVLIAGLVTGEERVENLVDIAQEGAVMTLKSSESVSRRIKSLRAKLGGTRTEHSRL